MAFLFSRIGKCLLHSTNTYRQLMESSTFGSTIKRITKKVFLALVVIGLIGFSFMYWGVHDEGLRAGRILRISKKGILFKTYEGQLNLETFGALKGASPIMESFDFSVEKSDDAIIKELEAVALSGERINLHYKKRFVKFSWRGDTKYFVTKVERTGGAVRE
jgi:hypothetical protein